MFNWYLIKNVKPFFLEQLKIQIKKKIILTTISNHVQKLTLNQSSITVTITMIKPLKVHRDNCDDLGAGKNVLGHPEHRV